jgi:hypothetical protein
VPLWCTFEFLHCDDFALTRFGQGDKRILALSCA